MGLKPPLATAGATRRSQTPALEHIGCQPDCSCDCWQLLLADCSHLSESPCLQVGPKGVHLEKDNIFNSQAYAAGAPAITIGNEPSTSGGSSSSSSQPAYSGASQTAPSSGSQNSQTTQNAYGSTSQAPTTSGYSTGVSHPPEGPLPEAAHWLTGCCHRIGCISILAVDDN